MKIDLKYDIGNFERFLNCPDVLITFIKFGFILFFYLLKMYFIFFLKKILKIY